MTHPTKIVCVGAEAILLGFLCCCSLRSPALKGSELVLSI